MSGYAKVPDEMWDWPWFAALRPDAKSLVLWSWTNKRSRLSGLFQVPLAVAAAEIGMSESRVEKVLSLPGLAAHLKVDAAGGWWWACDKAATCTGPKQTAGARAQAASLPAGTWIRQDWAAAYGVDLDEPWPAGVAPDRLVYDPSAVVGHRLPFPAATGRKAGAG